MPKASIVVPVYKVKEYLEKCVRSLLAQTERDFELILVDDGSPDECGALCDRLAEEDSRIRVIHQENMGLGGARNTGIAAARGDWLLLIDSDDWVEPDILKKALCAAEEQGADLVLFSFRTVDEQGNTLQTITEALPANVPFSPKERRELFLCFPCAWNKLYRRSLFTESSLQYPSRVWYEDIRTTLKLYALMGETGARALWIDDLGYHYLQRAGSIMNSANLERNREILWAFDDLLSWFREQGLFETYRDELEYLVVYHVGLTASARVARQDPKSPLLEEFRSYLKKEFPGWRENPYLGRLSRGQRLLLSLAEKRRYGLIRLLFRVRG